MENPHQELLPTGSQQHSLLHTRPLKQIQAFALHKDKPSTIKAYNTATKHLTRWWNDRKREAITTNPTLRHTSPTWQLTPPLLANWIMDMYAAGRSYSQVNQARSALALHLSTTSIPKHQWITQSPLVKATLKAYYRNTGPARKRFPIRGYILHHIAHQFFLLYPSTTAQLLTLALYTSYYCLLRVSELVHSYGST